MSPEEQRVAIAEACGWTHDSLDLPLKLGTKWVNPKGRINHQCLFPNFPSEVPDYLNDLNAMREAEKVLIAMGGLPTYQHFLRFNEIKDNDEDWYGEIHASAAQRAEAFLRTINKWID